MPETEGKFVRVKNGLSHFARVHLSSEEGSQGVEIDCRGDGWIARGYIEEVPKEGYDDWKAGAMVGAEFALRIAGVVNQRVIIDRIEGLTTDTNPTIVAAATANGVWKVLGFEPSQAIIARVEQEVFESWKLDYKAIPKFDFQ